MAQNHIEQPGLRARMGREGARISSQHRQLDTLYEMIGAAAAGGEHGAALRAFQRFADAFDAHISLEDAFYFPAVRGMHPHVTAELEALVEEHHAFRRQVGDLERLFDGCDPDAWRGPLERFVDAVSAHELREEELLARVAPRRA
jgi:hemerythrin-like domain-containing protein